MRKRASALVLAATLLLGMAGCGSNAKNSAVYIQGELDSAYKGTYTQEYLDLVEGMTEADVEERYDYWTETEGEYLLSYLDVNYYDGEVSGRAQEVVKKIYEKCKYTVGEGELLKSGDIAAEVTVSPIELLHLLDEDVYQEVWDDVVARAGLGPDTDFEAMDDDTYTKLESEYGMTLLDKVEALIPQITYGKDQSVLLQMKKDDDGLYVLEDAGFQKIDEMMIDYYGEYME